MESPIVNAVAIRAGWSLFIELNGGLARRPEVSSDGFTMVICHELGHFLAGLPYRTGSEAWASSEGQSDYFATLACARKLWKNDIETNQKSLKKLQSLKGGEDVKKRCDKVWPTDKERNLCYRTAVVAHSLGGLSAYIKKNPIRPEFNTPDKSVVEETSSASPWPSVSLRYIFSRSSL